MPRPPLPESAERNEQALREDFLSAAERGAASQGLQLVAELGRRGDAAAYLVREGSAGALAVGLVAPEPDGPGYSFTLAHELDVSLPGPASTCPTCGRDVDGWTRFCACGTDLSGIAPANEEEREALLERVRQATIGDVEIIGSIPYSAGGGVAYFARKAEDAAVVALWMRDEGTFEDGSQRIAIATSEPIRAATDTASGEFVLTPTDPAIPRSSMGSGLLAKQPTPNTQQAVAVPKVCPHCGEEYETGSRFCPIDGTPLRPKGSADPLIGRIIAERYIVLKRLGEGGMGRVYLAEHVKMNRQCAIKVMSASLVNDSESAKRFAREASSAAQIIHPNVAAVFDYGESDALLYIVMEYVEGEPLTYLLAREHKLPPQRALDLTRQVLDGLAAAHELGIVHRDLKPDNIIVSQARNGREVAKVVDFGIAKAMEGGDEALTRTGLVIGTPEYMSPEQLLGDPVDARSDIYSLGCILYQMLTGSPTFDCTTREQMIKRRLTEEPPHPRAVEPELPPALDVVVHRMLARAPDDRYTSAHEVRDLLAPMQAMSAMGVAMHRPTPRSAPTVMLEAAGPGMEAARRRRRRMVMGGVGGIVVIAALAAATLARGRATPAGQPSGSAIPNAAAIRAPVAAVPQTHTVAVAGNSAGAKVTGDHAAQKTAARHSDTAGVDPRSAATAPKLSADGEATHRVIDGYLAAINKGDIAGMRAIFPKMTDDQERFWRKNVFDVAKNIRATVSYTKTAINGPNADVDFVMTLRYEYRNGNSTAASKWQYHALLARSAGKWIITELRWK